MRKDNGGKGGTIVNISSIVGLMQSFLLPVYSAAKSAVLQFSNCLGVSIVDQIHLLHFIFLKDTRGKQAGT